MSEVNCPCVFSPVGFEHNCPIHDPSPPSDPQREGSETPECDASSDEYGVNLSVARRIERHRNQLLYQLTAAREALETDTGIMNQAVSCLLAKGFKGVAGALQDIMTKQRQTLTHLKDHV